MISKCDKNDETLYATALSLAEDIRKYSVEVDELGKFPEQSIQLLRENGLMGINVSNEYGGLEASLESILAICKLLGQNCLSTAMIWSMHIQQVELIQRFATETLKKRLLPRIAAGEVYVVSVTSDIPGNGRPFTTKQALEGLDQSFVVNRSAPVVTGGAYGDAYVVLMRASLNGEKLTFAIIERNQAQVDFGDTWNAMGVRGTQSCGLAIRAQIPEDQVMNPEGFDKYCLECLAPVGHLVWSASWFGAVKGVYSRFIQLIRSPEGRRLYNLESDYLAHELGVIRSKLDMVESYIEHFQAYYSTSLTRTGVVEGVNHYTFKIKTNNLKLIASELLNEAVDQLVQLGGVAHGYLKTSELHVERAFRDLRSAKLMLNNNALYMNNGRISFIEKY